MNTMFFKVLREGDGQVWPLPSTKRPGRWTRIADPREYNSNSHGVTNPLRWWQPRAKLYPVEVELKVSSRNSLARRLLADYHKSFDEIPMYSSVRCRLWPEITRNWPYLKFRPDIQCFLAATARSQDPNCDVSWADLYWADLHGVDLSESKLLGTNLTEANLEGVNLAGAYLTWASLRGACLNGATLTGANLYGADLVEADLVGAYRPDDPPDDWVPDCGGWLCRA